MNVKFEKLNEYLKDKPKLKEVLESLVTLVVAFIIFFFIFNVFIMNISIPSESMCPTLNVGDRLIGTRILGEIRRGDIVCFPCPDNGDTYIKRVIGLPGETVMIENGHVYINGEILDESGYDAVALNPAATFGPYEVPEDCYFMLGDNRNSSADSRLWRTTPYINKKDIKSRVLFKYYKGFQKIERL